MLAWANIHLFDYRNVLLSGKTSILMWSVPRGFDELLNPTGIPGKPYEKFIATIE